MMILLVESNITIVTHKLKTLQVNLDDFIHVK